MLSFLTYYFFPNALLASKDEIFSFYTRVFHILTLDCYELKPYSRSSGLLPEIIFTFSFMELVNVNNMGSFNYFSATGGKIVTIDSPLKLPFTGMISLEKVSQYYAAHAKTWHLQFRLCIKLLAIFT